MNTIMDIVRNIIALFIDDDFLAFAALVVIAGTAFLILVLRVEPLIAGGVLLAGNVAVLVLGAIRTAQRKERP